MGLIGGARISVQHGSLIILDLEGVTRNNDPRSSGLCQAPSSPPGCRLTGRHANGRWDRSGEGMSRALYAEMLGFLGLPAGIPQPRLAYLLKVIVQAFGGKRG